MKLTNELTFNFLFLSLIPLQIYFVSGVTQERTSEVIVTVTMQYNDAISKKEEFSSVAHLTCLAPPLSIVTKGNCCLEMAYAVESLCNNNNNDPLFASLPQHSICRKNDFRKWCMTVAAPIPSMELDNEYDSKLQFFYLPTVYIAVPNINENMADNSLTMETNKYNGLFQQFSFWRKSNKWFQNTDISSPFQSLNYTFIALENEIVSNATNMPKFDLIDAYYENFEGTLTGFMDSTLSENGGMHRHNKHKVVFSVADKFITQIDGEMIILQPISEEVFISVDDPFDKNVEDACTISLLTKSQELLKIGNGFISCNVELIMAPGTHINIEQPSFNSIQHVLKFRISFRLDKIDELEVLASVQIQFTTVVHVRYPSPIVQNLSQPSGEKGKGLVKLYTPSPFFYKGNIKTVSSSTNDGSNLKREFSLKVPFKKGISYIDAPSGHGSHYEFVVLLTLVFALLGAVSILKDLSKVTIWC